MSEALLALRAGAAALLEAAGKGALAALVRSAQVELAGQGESWSLGSREVTAHHVALAVGAAAFTALAREPEALSAVRAAFAQAMRSTSTEMADLHVELLLPGIERAWGHAYRDAPARDRPAPPRDPAAVLAGAAALLQALGDPVGAAMLGRASLSQAAVPGADDATPITRVVVEMAPEDRARTWRDPELEERLRRAVHDAAIRAAEQVVVELGVAPR